jgi:hypothetical protein
MACLAASRLALELTDAKALVLRELPIPGGDSHELPLQDLSSAEHSLQSIRSAYVASAA